MSEGRSSISQAKSYREIAEFWDTHDLADYWDQTEPVEFEVEIQSEATYYALERQLSHKLTRAADERGVSAGTLLNIWIQEKLAEGAKPTS
jgi:metal-dependent HD superfamily phosphatase/phosphodiesterase